MRPDIVIAGYSETKIDLRTDRSAYELGGEAFDLLLQSTGLAKREIDGLSVNAAISEACNPFFAVFMSEALGLAPTWLNLSGLGGGSSLAGVARAASAIRDGQCEAAVVLGADALGSFNRSLFGAWRGEFLEPTGALGPPAAFGLLMSRYAQQYGLSYEALGKIAITQREHALLNDNACPKLRKPLSMEEYLASRMIADPLRLLDCVMVCSGANALLVTTEAKARSLGLKKMARVAAYAELTSYGVDDPLIDMTATGHGRIAPRIYAQAGLRPSDVRMFHPYDDFTIAVVMQLEDFGFAPRGKGCDFVLATDLSCRGELPLNTGGGQISAGQPGLAGGGLNLVEAVRQLFGEGGARQVADPRNALVTAIGMIPYGRNWSVSAAMILEQMA
jgi:acetyl-CoA acetyltransferase